MLNMSSVPAFPPSGPPDPDRTARARIRDAAIAQFGRHGVAGTSLKVIAAEAGVSQPLIVHHFGSKDGLRRACDEHVAAVIRQRKLDALSQGPGLDVFATLRASGPDSGVIMRYLSRTLGDGTPQVAAIIDEMVDDAVDYMAEGVRSGLVRPSEFPRERAVILVLWSLGMVTLHDHVERLLGVDLGGDPTQLGPYLLPAMELLAGSLFTEGVYEQMRATFPLERHERGNTP